MTEEIKINKLNKSITFINNEIAYSQFGIADEILNLITNLQQENEKLKEDYKELIELIDKEREHSNCLIDRNYKHLLKNWDQRTQIKHLQNLRDKTTNYYLKTLAKNGSMPDEAVEMYNLLEENK